VPNLPLAVAALGVLATMGFAGLGLSAAPLLSSRRRRRAALVHQPESNSVTITDTQSQTARTFGYKWHRTDDFESPAMRNEMRRWLIERYGPVGNADWWSEYGERPTLLDAGCGAGFSTLELFGSRLATVDYVGVDISDAIEVAERRFRKAGLPGRFVRDDITNLPFPENSVDVIFSEGVMHHTDSTERAFRSLAGKLKRGGRFLFYVYRKKGPIREFTDDYVRDRVRHLSPEQAWEALMPLTKLAKALGELDVEIDIAEPIDVLGIPAGKVNLQRFFYSHVCKLFYRSDLTLDELNLNTFDWFTPANAHRHTEEEVRWWCADAGLEIERENVQEAGITVVARKR
jgi:arsenite methyltransferase